MVFAVHSSPLMYVATVSLAPFFLRNTAFHLSHEEFENFHVAVASRNMDTLNLVTLMDNLITHYENIFGGVSSNDPAMISKSSPIYADTLKKTHSITTRFNIIAQS
jgi:hypothetical protein